MSSTNKTANYNLSQFIGTDKPAWLTDYNSDMSKIDAGIDAAKDTADAASGSASAATTAIGDLTALTTTAKTDLVSAINEVDTNADTASSLASNANTVATQANTKVNALAAKFNLSSTTEYTSANITIPTNNGSIVDGKLYLVKNSDASLFKLYGVLRFSGTSTANVTLRLPNTGIEVDEAYTIASAANSWYSQHGENWHNTPNVVVNNNYIEITNCKPIAANAAMSLQLFPCLYINSNFGDDPTPVPPQD